jgi:A118 family predicted phage portal protein
VPLPDPNALWPPLDHRLILEELRTFDAWYTGDRDQLAEVYSGISGYAHGGDMLVRNRPSQYRGGLQGRLSRFFWGEPGRLGKKPVKLHVPAASDIASTSAGLLFAEPPTITAADEASQARLDDLLDEDFWDVVTDGAELCSGLGGVFMRVCWDVEVSQKPIVTAIGPDLAIPRFRFGKLIEVTFTWQLYTPMAGTIYRHLENHSMVNGECVVEHALYQGGETSLGQPVPLTEHLDTQALVDALAEDGVVHTGLDRLDVVYVPNVPSRKWRKRTVGAEMGQPDIAGVEPLLDALDEAWTSWMRDIRLGKSRVVISQAWLHNDGPGQGASFDLDEELLVKVNIPPNQDAPLTLIQPAIRNVEHAGTTMALLERCIDGAGYSLQTFGLSGDVAMTATESNSRDQKSQYTRGRKIRRWKPGLVDLVQLVLAVDAKVFESGVKVAPPTVVFPPTVDLQSVAQSALLLFQAESASMETRVAMAQPGLDETERAAEVARIKAEQAATAALAAPMADPTDDPGADPSDPADDPKPAAAKSTTTPAPAKPPSY